jgi:lysozyme
MGFNLGIQGLLKFTNTLSYIEQGKYELPSASMLASKWAKQVGQRARRLAEIMRTGELPEMPLYKEQV